jgi:hypothetical protein
MYEEVENIYTRLEKNFLPQGKNKPLTGNENMHLFLNMVRLPTITASCVRSLEVSRVLVHFLTFHPV